METLEADLVHRMDGLLFVESVIAGLQSPYLAAIRKRYAARYGDANGNAEDQISRPVKSREHCFTYMRTVIHRWSLGALGPQWWTLEDVRRYILDHNDVCNSHKCCGVWIESFRGHYEYLVMSFGLAITFQGHSITISI